MDTKPLLYGLAGFFIGGFIVALAATTFDKPENKEANSNPVSISDASNDDLVKSLHDDQPYAR